MFIQLPACWIWKSEQPDDNAFRGYLDQLPRPYNRGSDCQCHNRCEARCLRQCAVRCLKRLSLERRKKLVSLAESWGVAIVEDDPYSQLRYEGDPISPLIALDAIKNCSGKTGYAGSVLYHGTFSKLLAPGLRIGWVVAPHEVIQQLAALKQGIDLHTSTLTQMIAYEVARSGFLEQHIERLRAIYCHRRNVMLEAMDSYFPDGVHWTRPRGGLFILVTLPSGIDAMEVLVKSLKKMVAFFPCESFYPCGGGENTLRLNFSNAKPDRIVEGVRRLGEVLEPLCREYRD